MVKKGEITVALGTTINMGNFNSKRVDISISLSLPDESDETITVVHDRLYSIVSQKLTESILRFTQIEGSNADDADEVHV